MDVATRRRGTVTRTRLLDLIAGPGCVDFTERFWRYVDRREDDECWEWTGARTQSGYGQLGIQHYTHRAHRVSFVIAFGWEPIAVLHKCDNPPCVNPHHLFGGTQGDNMADCAAKGRLARQLQPAVISTILALAECGLSPTAIARQTKASRRSVGRVLKRGVAA